MIALVLAIAFATSLSSPGATQSGDTAASSALAPAPCFGISTDPNGGCDE